MLGAVKFQNMCLGWKGRETQYFLKKNANYKLTYFFFLWTCTYHAKIG